MPIVCGIHPVLEALGAGSRTIERVVVTKGVRNKRILEVIKRASERGVPLRFEPREALDRAADGERHQGVLAIVAEKGLLSLDELTRTARTPALFMLLDGVEDPRNLGAIIRSVDAAGADGVILPDRHTASLSDAASRTAAGALESVKIARIGNVVQSLEALKAKGFWIVGFDGSGKERWDAIDYKRPVVLVLGGEGKGIRRLVKEHCDHIVSLPVFGQVSSLNVSVAAGIALYEAVRQRGSVPTMARPIPPRALVAKKPVVIGPPPEDREEDPGAKRRAAAIASLAAMSEPVRASGPDAKAPAEAAPAAAEAEEAEAYVPEASLESVRSDDDDEAGVRRTPGPDDEEPGDDDDDADLEDLDDDSDDDEDGDDEGDDEGDEDDGDDGDDDDDDDDGGDDEDDDDGEDDDYDEDDDPGDAVSDLNAPFMPEDNSGSGEVTWGSEKDLHAHRPRREGERRFGNGGGRRNGRSNDRKKRRKSRGGNPQGGQRPQRPARPPQAEGQAGAPPEANSPQNGAESRGDGQPQQPRDPNRPGRRRNRRRRGRGRNGGGDRPQRDPNAPQGQPRGEGEAPAGGGEPRQGGDREPRQGGDRPAREGQGNGEAGRRDRDRRRRRRRGRRGPGGRGGQAQGGSNGHGGGGSESGGGSNGGGGGSNGGGGSSSGE